MVFSNNPLFIVKITKWYRTLHLSLVRSYTNALSIIISTLDTSQALHIKIVTKQHRIYLTFHYRVSLRIRLLNPEEIEETVACSRQLNVLIQTMLLVTIFVCNVLIGAADAAHLFVRI